jgi:hypothetical protein
MYKIVHTLLSVPYLDHSLTNHCTVQYEFTPPRTVLPEASLRHPPPPTRHVTPFPTAFSSCVHTSGVDEIAGSA